MNAVEMNWALRTTEDYARDSLLSIGKHRDSHGFRGEGVPSETRANLRSRWACKTKKTAFAAPSTRRSVQFLAALYIHTLILVILAVFSRNTFSRTIRTMLSVLF